MNIQEVASPADLPQSMQLRTVVAINEAQLKRGIKKLGIKEGTDIFVYHQAHIRAYLVATRLKFQTSERKRVELSTEEAYKILDRTKKQKHAYDDMSGVKILPRAKRTRRRTPKKK